jgi:hypothetical protein
MLMFTIWICHRSPLGYKYCVFFHQLISKARPTKVVTFFQTCGVSACTTGKTVILNWQITNSFKLKFHRIEKFKTSFKKFCHKVLAKRIIFVCVQNARKDVEFRG